MDRQTRHISIGKDTNAQLRVAGEGQPKAISGVIPFGERQVLYTADQSYDGKPLLEKFAPHIISTLPYQRCMLLRNHQSDSVLGREGANMEVRMEGTNLVFTANEITESPFWQETHALTRQGIFTEMSFGMEILDVEYKETATEHIATITRVNWIYEISLVSHPAYAGTSAHSRNRITDFYSAPARQRENKENIEPSTSLLLT